MRIAFLLIVLSINSLSYAQEDERISTMDFVQILNDNREEALFYYQNNWKILRESAMQKGYIQSYQLLEAPADDDASFQLILMTTYPDKGQYDLREDHFRELIKEQGELKLMNDKKPGEFRKTLFSKEMVKHWD